jgi:DNA primase
MSVVDDIKAGVCISELAAQYTEVKRHGRLHVCRCLCGQNRDRNPSFTLYDDDNHFHCFACGRHGSVIDLVMLVEGVDFKAALDRLKKGGTADCASVQPKRVLHMAAPTQFHTVTDAARVLLEVVTTHYEAMLFDHKAALHYLHGRGLNDATIAKMRIGYAGGGLGRHLFTQGLDLTLAAQIGLLTPHGELMRGRIIFPVLDAKGRPVWLIGRAMVSAAQPKYLGLPDGLVHKKPMVIGTPQLGVIWVEGPFDVAALVQWGLDADYRIVGLLGTAHASMHSIIAECSPAAPQYIALDQDDAGERASQAMLAQMSSQRVARVRWAGAKDCGELLAHGQRGRERFLHALAAATEAIPT